MAPLRNLSQSAQLESLKGAKIALILVGVLTLAFQIFLFSGAEKEYDEAVDAELSKQGTSMRKLQNNSPETVALLDEEKVKAMPKLRAIYGGGIALGIIFIICGFAVYSKPVIATVTGLVLYVGAAAAMATIDPSSLVKGIILKIIIIAVLAKSVKAAFAYEKENRAA